MNPAVLDCSVLVKWFLDEAGTAAALCIRDEVIAGTIEGWIPPLALAEFPNALWQKTERKEVDRASAKTIVADLLALPLRKAPMEPLVLPALQLAMECHITVYDACYAALAYHLRAPLITADGPLARALQQGPIAIQLIA